MKRRLIHPFWVYGCDSLSFIRTSGCEELTEGCEHIAMSLILRGANDNGAVAKKSSFSLLFQLLQQELGMNKT